MLAEQLRGQGVNVGVIDGSLSAQQKSEERLKFTAKGAERGEYDILIATDAAQTGLNLASGRFLIHYDVPMTKKAYDQRSARIHRLGQIADTDIHTMMLDTPEEKVAMARMSRKGEMGEVLQSRSEVMDDTGLAGEIERMRLGERRSS
jgi:superfamily II DNA/RNA helicase